MRQLRRALLSIAVILLPLLAGCSSSSTPAPPAAPSFVYYTLDENNTNGNPQLGVVSYPVSASSTLAATLTTSATTGLAFTQNMAFDASGRLFVVNAPTTPTISVFTPPLTSSSPATFILTMPAAITSLFGIAFDTSGNLWVTTDTNNIYEFNGPFTTTATLAAANVTLASPSCCLNGIAFDASGNLWVAIDNTNSIAEYKKGTGFTNATPIDHSLAGVNFPVSVAFDKAGDLFSSGTFPAQGTVMWNSSNLGSGATPNVVDATGLLVGFNALQMTFDAAGNLYVADCGTTGRLYVYPTATQAFSTTLAPFVYTDANITAQKCVEGVAIR